MSLLTNSLNRIMSWMQQNRPARAQSFLPGLPRQEIEQAVEGLPNQLPEELFELYQWRNGTSEWDAIDSVVFPSLEFMPLNEAVESCQGLLESFGGENPLLTDTLLARDEYLFPFTCENSSCYHAVLLRPKKQQSSPVIDVGAEGDLDLAYSSLTSMMMTLAEYFESGAFYMRDDGFLDCDEEVAASIFLKYNSGINRLY